MNASDNVVRFPSPVRAICSPARKEVVHLNPEESGNEQSRLPLGVCLMIWVLISGGCWAAIVFLLDLL